MLNFFPCFRSEFATDELVLHGTIRLDSKIRSENVHFHDSFWRKQTLAATKLFLSLTRIDFAVGVSSRAVRISSRAVPVFPAFFQAHYSDMKKNHSKFGRKVYYRAYTRVKACFRDTSISCIFFVIFKISLQNHTSSSLMNLPRSGEL